MFDMSVTSGASTAGSSRRCARLGCSGLNRWWGPAILNLPQLGSCDPVVAQRVDVFRAGFDLGLLCLKQLKRPHEHGVVLELRLLRDLLPQGYDHLPEVVSTCTSGQQPVASGARGRSDLDRR